METRCGVLLSIDESSATGDARRRLSSWAQEFGFDESDVGRVALITTELAGNLLKHATKGQRLLAQPRMRGGVLGLEIIALDCGPGIPNMGDALRDGFSTRGTPGTGLGAVRRTADEFDIQSTPGLGTIVLARIWPRSVPVVAGGVVDIGSVIQPKPGEPVCGDGWATSGQGTRQRLLVVDGLGHGEGAAEASRAAVEEFRTSSHLPLVELVLAIHGALRSTRGAAMAVVDLDAEAGEVRFSGVGNIAGTVAAPERDRHMVSSNGISGHQLGRPQEFTYEWPQDGLVILHSDGITSRWNLSRYAGVYAKDPALVAGLVYRDHARDSDDATVIVARRTPP